MSSTRSASNPFIWTGSAAVSRYEEDARPISSLRYMLPVPPVVHRPAAGDEGGEPSRREPL
eukprot:1039737-Lingulodinium_polyedra.AAC.1